MTNNPNKTQKDAIDHNEGPSIVIAGAGTGKTYVITQRIIRLITNDLATADEILALTFTNKAAEEMSERVDKALPLGTFVEWILTFHSFCERILKQNAIHFDLDPNYQLINQIEAVHLFKENIYNFSLSTFKPSGNKYKFVADIVQYFSKLQDELISPEKLLTWSVKNIGDFLQTETLDTSLFWKYIEKKHITKNKDQITYDGKVTEWKEKWIFEIYPTLSSIENKKLAQLQIFIDQFELARVFHEYNIKKNELDVLDFGDMVFQTIRLFENRPNILQKYRSQFKYILIDEFQDTNLAQYYLMKILASPQNNIMVVGDDDQSIYRFRGASISNILTFQDDYPDCKKYVLTENYRSTQPILDLAYQSISNNNPNRLEIKANVSKKLKSNKLDVPASIILNIAKDDYNEALYIAKEIVKLTGIETKEDIDVQKPLVITQEIAKKDNKPLITNNPNTGLFSQKETSNYISINEIAILAKSLNYTETLISLFNQYGIPYKLPNTQNLLTTQEVKFILSFLRAVNDINDTPSFLHLLNNCFIKINSRDQILINQESKRMHIPIIRFLEDELSIKIGEQEFGAVAGDFFKRNSITDETIESIQKVFSAISKALIQNNDGVNLEKIIIDMIEYFAIPQRLTKEDSLRSSLQLKNIERFVRMSQNFSARFKTHEIASFLRYIDTIQVTNQPSEDEDEYQNTDGVILSTIHRAKGLEFNTVFLLGVANKRLPGKNNTPPIEVPDELLSKQLVETSSKESQIAEERRLFYVALTRAKQNLYVGYAQKYRGNLTPSDPSIFITELGFEVSKNEEFTNKDSLHNSFELLSDEISANASTSPEILSQKAIWDITNKSISHTQIKTYEECPYRFKLSSIEKTPIRQSVSLYFGNAIHETLRNVFTYLKDTKNKLPIDKALKLTDDYFKPYMFDSMDEYKETIERGRKVIKSFYEKFYTGLEKPIHLETSFNALLKDIVITGKIDRIDVIDGNKYKIIDYKTGSLRNEAEVKKDLQLKIYAYGIEKFKHIFPTEIAFIFVEHETEIVTKLKPDDLDNIEKELLSKITPVVEGIKNGQFDPKPSIYTCAFCNYKNVCNYSAK
ncbi:MAG TPA: ATP-dependent DNA helicase [Candidatus Dojkabacteria bacterium]|nr:ATP-dependent DNA helicase [Candidatus Dojkabacteria bacterium]